MSLVPIAIIGLVCVAFIGFTVGISTPQWSDTAVVIQGPSYFSGTMWVGETTIVTHYHGNFTTDGNILTESSTNQCTSNNARSIESGTTVGVWMNWFGCLQVVEK